MIMTPRNRIGVTELQRCSKKIAHQHLCDTFLNCTYCYMYNLGDSSYLGQPKVMSDAVVTASMEKIRRHCLRHGVTEVGLVLHGGEPMLAGRDFFRRFVAEAQRVLRPELTPHFMMQTNGTLSNCD